jgi:uncharacterized protein
MQGGSARVPLCLPAEPRRLRAAQPEIGTMIEGCETPHHLCRRALMTLLGATASGCNLWDGPVYVLTPVPGYALTGSPRTVAVRPVVLPQYLQQTGIVHTSELPLAIAAAPSEWWAEPLDVMIGRVVAQNLMQRLPGVRVVADPQPPFTPSDVWVELTLQRFDTNQTGDALVQAQVGVVGLRYLGRSAWRTVSPAGGSTSAMVTALSIALAHFTDLVAALVVESWAIQFH